MMRVYRYGARAPDVNGEAALRQLLLAHRYQNRLVEIERQRRARISAAQEAYPQIAPLAAAVAVLNERIEELKKQSKAARTRKERIPAELRAEKREAIVAIKARREELRAAKSSLREDAEVQARLAEISATAAGHARAARAESGVYWGTYLVCEQAMDAARSRREEPRFHRWDGTGRLAVQMQHGLAVAAAVDGGDTRLRLRAIEDTFGRHPGSRRSGKRWRVSLRIGTEPGGRDPIWTSAVVTLHRPLPPDGWIKWAWLQRTRIGPDYRWALHVVVEEPDAGPVGAADRHGTIAIDLGWRSQPDGVRAGYWRDSRNGHGELLMPASVLADLEHSRSIGAIRERHANACQATLRAWIAGTDRGALPEWFRTQTATLALWRGADRLARLAWRWHNERFPSDVEIYDTTIDPWRKQDRHLHRWHAHGGANIIGRRNEQYRLWACDLARRYRRIVIEQFDLRRVVGRVSLPADADEAERVKADRSSSQRHALAPSRFRAAIITAARRHGAEVVSVPAAWTTIDCSRCGVRLTWDPAPEIEHRCEACGETWDQDEGACRNLLARAASGPVTPIVGGALARAKSKRQQRFLQRRDRKGGAESDDKAGRSQDGGQTGESAGDLSADYAVPAQGVED